MSAINQYIELFNQNRDLVCSNSAHPLNALRQEALESLLRNPLPAKGSENYEVTDLETLLSPDFGINLARVPMDVNPGESFHCGVPNFSPALFFTVNDLWREAESAREVLPDGVEVCSLRRMAETNPELVEKFYGKAADIDNPVVALDSLLVQDGFCLHVKKGVRLERPLQLVNILSAGIPLMAVRRMLIIIEEDAEAKLLVCDHTQNDALPMLSLQTVEIFTARNSAFSLYDLEESSEKTSRLSSLYLHQEENSHVTIGSFTLFNGFTRNEYFSRFGGKHSSVKLYGMGIEDRSRCLDTYSYVDHAVGDCDTDELFKYVVDDEAVGAFAGRILVREGSAKTNAYQANRNLVGSDKARMYSKPQLEIYNDDVKCSHGTAIGQLDATQIFYMRSRGLSEETARLLLKQAFMADVIECVNIPAVKDRLHMLIERRFAGASVSCSDCSICHSNYD